MAIVAELPLQCCFSCDLMDICKYGSLLVDVTDSKASLTLLCCPARVERQFVHSCHLLPLCLPVVNTALQYSMLLSCICVCLWVACRGCTNPIFGLNLCKILNQKARSNIGNEDLFRLLICCSYVNRIYVIYIYASSIVIFAKDGMEDANRKGSEVFHTCNTDSFSLYGFKRF